MIPPRFTDNGRCFACGPHNTDGLHLHFQPDGEHAVRAEITLPPRFQGWEGVAHGGIVMMLLDEAMAHACLRRDARAVTASLESRFKAPVLLGAPLTIRGEFVQQRRNVLYMRSTIEDAAGTILASAEGSFVSRGTMSS